MSLTKKVTKSNVLYLTIAGGNMVQKSDSDNSEAIKREYEKKDGTTGTKWELHHRDLEGRITDLSFKDSDFGEQFTITIQNGEDVAKLTTGTDSKYFADFGKKLPNIDLSKDVVLNAYDMTADNDKRYTGVSIKQNDEKVKNAYWDGEKNIGGFPEVPKEEKDDYDSDDWKMFFIKIKKFLKKKVEATVVPTYEGASVNASTPDPLGSTPPEDDLPF